MALSRLAAIASAADRGGENRHAFTHPFHCTVPGPSDAICRSPERPDLKMSQEEAQGWAVAAVVDRELLPDEARPIGKRVDNYFEDNCFERTMVWKSPSWVFRWRMGCWFSVLIICLCHHSIFNSWQIHFRHFI